eukprot:CAMPEP_0194479340 /NCGR_PEP_ID=MMETSP0253-20130528/2502_1 /TAXON_ID=2966 /ORGANISM="Noctiluca scintillans" /LENGTH=30 /DNA_ID= /DNA_START= /DNA_END= /DNA_ORIENTATION=
MTLMKDAGVDYVGDAKEGASKKCCFSCSKS